MGVFGWEGEGVWGRTLWACACLLLLSARDGVPLSPVLRLVVGASVSRGVGWLTCGPRCPPSPRAVSSCQDGRHVIGTFAKAANSAQFWCSHVPSHSLCHSGCVLGQSLILQRPSGHPFVARILVSCGSSNGSDHWPAYCLCACLIRARVFVVGSRHFVSDEFPVLLCEGVEPCRCDCL